MTDSPSNRTTGQSLRRRLALTSVSLLIAALIWLPCMHLFFKVDLDARGLSPMQTALLGRQVALWKGPPAAHPEVQQMRAANPEWDFMGRTYLVLSLANIALRDPAGAPQHLALMDTIIADTLRTERNKGMRHFLMDYVRGGVFVVQPARSLFVDGEIALMLAARRMVEEKPEYKPLLTERVVLMVRHMKRSPVLSGESYPDECWTFCNTVALAAIRMADALDGSDHSKLAAAWVTRARERLINEKTGLLVSAYRFTGETKYGPEGSSIWMAAHCLQLIDQDFANDQYARAKKELGRSMLGFGYAREWPASEQGHVDIDSGPVMPGLQLSPASSGLAMVAASAFGDREYLAQLLTSLRFGGLPARTPDGGLKFCASNQVGDAVALYAVSLGPLWERVKERLAK
jgi:linalool dehydratase/isomerase-like protein